MLVVVRALVKSKGYSNSISRLAAGSRTLLFEFRIVVSSQKDRCFSSQSGGGGGAFKGAYGLPFTVSPEAALVKFEKWARGDQGLNSFLMPWSNVRIAAAYCPVWSFDVNVRYVVTDPTTGQKRFDYKPDIFSVYGRQSVINIPGLAAYSGHTYRRSLIDPLCNTTLVFLGDQVVPFGAWMLRDMKLLNDQRLEIFPDPWNATRGRAFAIVREGLENLPGYSENDDKLNVSVQTELLSSRRVYLPTYVIEYKVLGMEYQAFVSGCDEGADVSGISHKIFDVSNNDVNQASSFLSSALSTVQQSLRVFGGRNIGTLIVVGLQFFGSLLARVLARLPLIGALGGAFIGFRKIIRPWMDNRAASAEWERQREQDAAASHEMGHTNDFADSGAAKRYFQANRNKILRHLSGEHEHDQGSFDWYADWEKWARQQYEQQQRQQQQAYQQTYQQQQQQQQQRRQQRARPKTPEYQWPFNPNDPYDVLGIKRGGSKEEVSAAFRKQMMMHHPDMHTNDSEAEKARAVERSKLITNAYKTIKSQMKN